jgi:hypothetical protein
LQKDVSHVTFPQSGHYCACHTCKWCYLHLAKSCETQWCWCYLIMPCNPTVKVIVPTQKCYFPKEPIQKWFGRGLNLLGWPLAHPDTTWISFWCTHFWQH